MKRLTFNNEPKESIMSGATPDTVPISGLFIGETVRKSMYDHLGGKRGVVRLIFLIGIPAMCGKS